MWEDVFRVNQGLSSLLGQAVHITSTQREIEQCHGKSASFQEVDFVFVEGRQKPINLHFSFKLRKGASVQSPLQCTVNCLQWLLSVALFFPRLMTNTCFK